MAVDKVTRSWSNQINVVTLGKGENEVTVGGETTLPFLHGEGDMPHSPKIALDVFDLVPETWSDTLVEGLGDVIKDPVSWAQWGAEDLGVDLIALHITAHAEEEDPATPEECAEMAASVAEAVDVPLIVWGAEEEEADNDMYPPVSQALAGERCLFGSATEDNYRTLTATCIADGHHIIGQSPIDINICKQVNVLVSDMGMPLENIVIYPCNGALGYGLEYAYTIIERTRLAALGGDTMMAMPVLVEVGPEVQRAKEVKATEAEMPEWGPEVERGIAWEAVTAASYLQSGADIVTLLQPKAIEIIRDYIDEFMAE